MYKPTDKLQHSFLDSREQRAKRAYFHAHLATAAKVTSPAALQRCKFDALLLAAGLLTSISLLGFT